MPDPRASNGAAPPSESAQQAYQRGMTLHRQGLLAAAAALYEKAIALAPDYAEAERDLGYALWSLKRRDAAIGHCERALALRPGDAEAENKLGSMLVEAKRGEHALIHYRTAIALKPDFSAAHSNLGVALHMLKRSEEAAQSFERAIALKPDYAAALYNLGMVLAALGRQAEAVARFEQAIGLRPNRAEFHSDLGGVLVDLGRFADAQKAVERAIELAPKRPKFYFNLARIKRFAAADRHFAALEELARAPDALPAAERKYLHFALGKALADLGRDDESFHHLLAGSALRRREVGYDEAATFAGFDRLRALFTRRLMTEKAGLGHPSAVPVFILGMPRSGSTLIEQILASHPQVFGAGELTNVENLVAGLAAFPNGVPALTGEQLHGLGARYIAEVAPAAPQAARITDKMPLNFRFAGLIHLVLPKARIIHTRRDPIDTCVSCISNLFAGNLPFTYDLAELGRYYRAYQALMAHWRDVLPAGVMLDIDYEDVVADIEREARRVVAFCGLDWDDACLAFHATQRPVRTASAAQVRRPIYASSVGRWRRHEALLLPLLAALGLG